MHGLAECSQPTMIGQVCFKAVQSTALSAEEPGVHERRPCLVRQGVGLQEAAEDFPEPVLHKGQVEDIASQQPQVKTQRGDGRKGKLHERERQSHCGHARFLIICFSCQGHTGLSAWGTN